ncbi:hypothetical protein HZA55_05690 [Candidatus Poribacteria bacterium]|nr:hypothetical protein [Candidatus Poribacteria bacterium]
MKKNILILIILFSGCSNNSPQEKLTPTFSSINQNIFKKKCALYTCHSDEFYKKSGNLNLSSDKAYNDLVNIPCKIYPNRLRVKPGIPDGSLLIQRLDGTIACGGVTERSRVTEEDIEIVREWIKNGALKN